MKPLTWTLPKFALLAHQLGGKDVACGVLSWLWHLASTFDPEHGSLPDTRWEALLAGTSVGQRAAEVGAILVADRWVDEEDGCYLVHDWIDHRPAYLNERLRKQRHRGKLSRDIPGHSGTLPGHSGTRDAPSVSVSVSDSEKSKNKNNSLSEADKEYPPQETWDGDQFPLASGKLYLIPMELYQKYRATYSWDIDPELRKCAQWCRENKPRRSSTARGMQRRITSWLNRRDDERSRGEGNDKKFSFADVDFK